MYVENIYSNKVKDKKLMIKSQSGDGKPWADSMFQMVKQFYKITITILCGTQLVVVWIHDRL